MKTGILIMIIMLCAGGDAAAQSIRTFNVTPENSPEENRINLQKAIDSLSAVGGSIYVEPLSEPYPMAGGLVLRRNVSLVGANAATPRGTRHPSKPQPVGSVFRITDKENVFIIVESATRISGIQFWYPEQATKDPEKIIEYPATISVSHETPTQGVTLRDLTFYGEYFAMDFGASVNNPCELITAEHCYGYPLGGTFIRIDRCYDIPRLLHCHVNPAINRFIAGGFSPAIVDRVISRKTYAYSIDNTDNAQLIDIFTFGTYGGIYLGPATYGQMTNFNFDCVAVGVHKMGNSNFNRNWQITQGAIIANTGDETENIHPFLIEGKGHTAISNVEAFSGPNGALTTKNVSFDFLKVTGSDRCTISLSGCRMRNYVSGDPLTVDNRNAIIQVTGCIDRDENIYRR